MAAGMGRRLGELTNDNTKCMLEVNGTRLINRTLDALSDIGISRVVLVVGYKAENVKRWVGDKYKDIDIVYVENSVYDKTNNIYSLFLAKEHLVEDDTLLLESDLIFEPSVLRRIVEEPYPNLALVDKYESWMDGTVVTLDEEQRIKSFISKDKFRYSDIESYFKTVNIYKFSRTSLRRTMSHSWRPTAMRWVATNTTSRCSRSSHCLTTHHSERCLYVARSGTR